MKKNIQEALFKRKPTFKRNKTIKDMSPISTRSSVDITGRSFSRASPGENLKENVSDLSSIDRDQRSPIGVGMKEEHKEVRF